MAMGIVLPLGSNLQHTQKQKAFNIQSSPHETWPGRGGYRPFPWCLQTDTCPHLYSPSAEPQGNSEDGNSAWPGGWYGTGAETA